VIDRQKKVLFNLCKQVTSDFVIIVHHEFHIPNAQGKTKEQLNALADECRWIALAFVGYW
jgi:hypothetical protein